MEWIVGVHKKASNIFCYVDTERIPLALSAISLGVKYFRRVGDIAAREPEPIPLSREEQRTLISVAMTRF